MFGYTSEDLKDFLTKTGDVADAAKTAGIKVATAYKELRSNVRQSDLQAAGVASASSSAPQTGQFNAASIAGFGGTGNTLILVVGAAAVAFMLLKK